MSFDRFWRPHPNTCHACSPFASGRASASATLVHLGGTLDDTRGQRMNLIVLDVVLAGKLRRAAIERGEVRKEKRTGWLNAAS